MNQLENGHKLSSTNSLLKNEKNSMSSKLLALILIVQGLIISALAWQHFNQQNIIIGLQQNIKSYYTEVLSDKLALIQEGYNQYQSEKEEKISKAYSLLKLQDLRMIRDEKRIKQLEQALNISTSTPSNFTEIGTKSLQFYIAHGFHQSQNSESYINLQNNLITFQGKSREIKKVYSQTFQKDSIIQLKLKLWGDPNQEKQFYLGVVSKIYQNEGLWYGSGNQLILKSSAKSNIKEAITSKSEITIKGINPAILLDQSSNIFYLEICIAENHLKFFDENQQTIVESNYKFEDHQEWRIVLGSLDTQILNIEILSSSS